MKEGLIVTLWLIYLISGCGIFEKEYIHPMDEKLPSNKTFDYISNIDSTKTTLEYFFSIDVQDSIVNNQVFEVDPYATLKYNKVLIDNNGDFYVLNDRDYYVERYNKRGDLIERIGGPGRGPGEFERVRNFTLDREKDKIFVIDLFGIEVFEKKGDRYSSVKEISNIFSEGYDLCVMEDFLFLSGFKTENSAIDSLRNLDERSSIIDGLQKIQITNPILKIDIQTGETIKSFGYKYESIFGFGPYDGQLSEMILSCNEESNGSMLIGVGKV